MWIKDTKGRLHNTRHLRRIEQRNNFADSSLRDIVAQAGNGDDVMLVQAQPVKLAAQTFGYLASAVGFAVDLGEVCDELDV